MSFQYKDIEKLLQDDVIERMIYMLESYYGVEIYMWRQSENIYTDVYGVDAGVPDDSDTEKVYGVLVGDDFFPSDSFSAGGFTEGWFYTRYHDEFKVGDLAVVKRYDLDGASKDRKYKVESVHSLGTTTEIIRRYRLSALG